MENRMIGFIGIDKHEIILYLSRILYHLGKKVLLVDYSENQALYYSIPIPMTLQNQKECIHYRGTDFIQGENFTMERIPYYDVILLDLGFQGKKSKIILCSKVFYVTDLQFHNVRKIREVNAIHKSDKYFIIKDVIPCKITPDYILEQIGEIVESSHLYILYQDEIDLKCKVQCQYDLKYDLRKLSGPMKNFLKETTAQLIGKIDQKEYKIAFRKAERGK